jgi:aspartate carbamoyltransferase regulatory subunit
MLTKTLSVSAIRNGTVIDHIPASQALRIVQLLKLNESKLAITLGLNLPSTSLGSKDILKIEDKALSLAEANQVAIFAPLASINIISNYTIKEKFQVAIPKSVQSLLHCPNLQCITNHEHIPSHFGIDHQKRGLQLKCKYCENSFTPNEIP